MYSKTKFGNIAQTLTLLRVESICFVVLDIMDIKIDDLIDSFCQQFFNKNIKCSFS